MAKLNQRSDFFDWRALKPCFPSGLHKQLLVCRNDLSLCSAAFLIYAGVTNVAFQSMPLDSHVTSFLNEAGLTSQVDLNLPSVDSNACKILANASLPEAAKLALHEHLSGLGLVRFEFLLYRSLGELLNETTVTGHSVWDIHLEHGDFHALAVTAADPKLSPKLFNRTSELLREVLSYFSGRLIYLRAPDLHQNPSGLRGLLASDPIWKLFADTCKEIQGRQMSESVVVSFPFVTHINEVIEAVRRLRDAGVAVGASGSFSFGLEIENPVSVVCSSWWINIIKQELDIEVKAVGIGTGDLTSTTLCASRRQDSNEVWHPSILLQLRSLSQVCRTHNIPCILSGAVAAEPFMQPFLKFNQILPSVEPAYARRIAFQAVATTFDVLLNESILCDMGSASSAATKLLKHFLT